MALPWRLLRELGEGGMGTVWLAERADGTYRREVALKLPRMSWTRGLAERIARESDILATLEHPHIARLYDAGVDALGRPWLALEYVQGDTIDAWCAARRCGLRERLALLAQACDAVAFAHSRLVIHRDLKPGNILVTTEGEVRLLDFGIARLLDPGGASVETEFGPVPMTPGYASPEQLRGEPLGTATDVYSLGVVAYELCAGQRPHARRRAAADLPDAGADHELPLPSRAAADPAVARALRGDIDAVLVTALAREPARRYAGAAAMADDLRRLLAGEAVAARVPPPTERAWRFLRRHRVPVASAALAATALASSAVIALGEARRAEAQRQHAEAAAAALAREAERADVQARAADRARLIAEGERQRALLAQGVAREAARKAEALASAERSATAEARQAANRATAVQDFLVGIFNASSARQDDPQRARQVTARELLDIGAQRLDGALEGQPAAHQQLADTLSALYAELDLTERSLALARRAEQEAVQLYGAGSQQHLQALATLIARHNEDSSVDPAAVDTLVTRAAALVSLPRRASASRAAVMRALAMAHEPRDLGQAEHWGRLALSEARAAGDDDALGEAMGVLGMVLYRQSRPAEAEPLLAESIDRARHRRTAWDLTIRRAYLAEVQALRLRFGAAIATLRAALADAQRRNGDDHLDTQQTRFRLGSLMSMAGMFKEALPLLDETRQRWSDQGAARQLQLSLVLVDLGSTLRKDGQAAEGERRQAEGLALRERLRPDSVAAETARQDFALTQAMLGRPELARRMLDEVDARLAAHRAGPGLADRQRLARAEVEALQGQRAAARVQLSAIRGAEETRPPGRMVELQADFEHTALDLAERRDDAASRRLRRVAEVLSAAELWAAAPGIVARWHLLCARLARQAGSGQAQEAAWHEAEAERRLVRHQSPTSELSRELRALRAQPPAPAPNGPPAAACPRR
jgi:serine/threonine-protein kinase